MAFLGRTARLREFKFQDNLQVGEHEQHLGRRNVEIGGGTLKLVLVDLRLHEVFIC